MKSHQTKQNKLGLLETIPALWKM